MSLRALVTTVIAIVVVGSIAFTAVYVRREARNAVRNGNGGGANGRDSVDRPLLELEELALEHHEQGRPAWKVRLSRLAVETGGRAITAGQLREGLIYNREGHAAVRVTAERVEYDAVSHDFDVTGKVRVVSPKGAVITTERSHWDNESRALTAPGQILLRTRDDITVTTSGMKFDTTTQKVLCPNQVRLRMGKIEAVGKDLVYELETNKCRWRDAQAVIDTEEAKRRAGIDS